MTNLKVSNLVLRSLTWKIVLALLDDILALGSHFTDHHSNVGKVFARFRQYQLKLKPKGCVLFRTSVELLDRTVGPDGVYVGDAYIETVGNWSQPNSINEVQRFCGFANYYRNFIPLFAQIASPLYQVSGKKAFQWDDDQ